MSKVLVTGGSGLTGRYLLDRLEASHHDVTCYLRPESTTHAEFSKRFAVAEGDTLDADSLTRAAQGQDVLIHLVNIRHTPSILEAARRSGVGRVVIVSTTSVHSIYHEACALYREMEGLIRASDVEWVIVRPSMIYGNHQDKNMHRLLRFIQKAPFVPQFAGGRSLIQPVHAEDLAWAVEAAAFLSEASRHAIDTPGADAVEYRELVRLCAEVLGKRRVLVSIPVGPAHKVLSLVEKTGRRLPIRAEQILRQTEDKAYPFVKAEQLLGYRPRPLRAGLSQQVDLMRTRGLL